MDVEGGEESVVSDGRTRPIVSQEPNDGGNVKSQRGLRMSSDADRQVVEADASRFAIARSDSRVVATAEYGQDVEERPFSASWVSLKLADVE